ncbi:hypothetical protein GBA52_003884 [Prunus armeniaca]|nr:hypothetical protein GBA52_003884 [Prunus armeniaca]
MEAAKVRAAESAASCQEVSKREKKTLMKIQSWEKQKVLLNEELERKREQIEASTKSKEDMIKLKAENNLQKYKDDIQKLEKEISQLRLKSDSSKIAALEGALMEAMPAK